MVRVRRAGRRGVREEPASLRLLTMPPARNLADLGRKRCALTVGGGELFGRYFEAVREATRKVYGVLVAMPQGHSRAPTPTSEAQ